MSTFEVLRYGDTDITSVSALTALPKPIIEHLWKIIHSPEEESWVLHTHACNRIAGWAKTAQTIREKEYVRGKFLQALRQVDPI